MNHRSRLAVALTMLFVAVACGQGPATPEAAISSETPSVSEKAPPTEAVVIAASPSSPQGAPQAKPATETAPRNWRYVNSGWVEPIDGETASAFAQELRVFVITNQQEFDAFSTSFTLRLSRGTAASLARIEFEDSILLAAYYLWRPVQGDPLSIVGFSIDNSGGRNRATVELELEDQPEGRLRPYLMAPMTVAAVEKGLFPIGKTIEFVFKLDGEPVSTVTAAIN